MNYDFDVADSTAQDASLPSYPVVQWVNGDPKLEDVGGLAFKGGFFFPYEAAGDGAEIEHWTSGARRIKSGKKIPGLVGLKAGITIVRYRRRWALTDADGKTIATAAWSQYQNGYRGEMQAVGFIKGYPSPVTFAFKGNTIRAVQAILQEHTRKVVAPVNVAAPEGKKLPLYAFYVGVEAGTHEQAGAGNKTTTVTPPVILLPAKINPEALYVGRERLIESQKLYHELGEWVEAWGQAESAAPLPRSEAMAALEAQAPYDPYDEAGFTQENEIDASDIPF